MNATHRAAATAALVAAMLALPVTAHHSHGNYDVNNYTHLEGRVSELLWVNPHTWIYLEVMDDSGEPGSGAPSRSPWSTARTPAWLRMYSWSAATSR